MKERVTIREVAKAANVSIATVSKALNGIDVVTPQTKARVVAAAKQLHYTPNLMGKNLKAKKTNMIGFYTHTIIGPYFSTLIEAIVAEAEKQHYGVNVMISSDKQVLTSHLLGNMVDGFIGFEDLIDEEALSTIRSEKIKAVFMDRQIKDQSISSIVFASRKGGQLATQHLIQAGHRKIGFLPGHVGVYDSDERYLGYQETMAAAGLQVKADWIIPGLFEEKASFDHIDHYLKTTDRKTWPTAWIAGNDLSAIGVMKAIEVNRLKVPQDFSVIGFDDIELLHYFKPRLTTIRNPIGLQGTKAVRELLALITGENKGDNHILDCHLIKGETTSNKK